MGQLSRHQGRRGDPGGREASGARARRRSGACDSRARSGPGAERSPSGCGSATTGTGRSDGDRRRAAARSAPSLRFGASG